MSDVDVEEKKQRGWPKGRKRKKTSKDENLPRRPMTGYVRFLAEKREELTKQNPNLSFAEITKILGSEWSCLASEEKKKYLVIADKEKAEYLQKMHKIQSSSSFRESAEKNKEMNESLAGSSKTSKPSQASSKSESLDIPIFTEAFLDHNKAKDTELRLLRKSNAEYEEQNTILQKHIDNLQNAITRLDNETNAQCQSNLRLQMKLHSMREMLVKLFKETPLPESGLLPTMKTIDAYMKQVYKIVQTVPIQHQEFFNTVQGIMLKIDKHDMLHMKS